MARNHSRQRDAIISFLSTRNDHPTAELVYDNVRMIYPRISLGTVYRNLNLLAEEGEIKRLRTKDSKDHFDADLSNHYHFICDKCFGVSDIFIDMTGPLTNEAMKQTNAEITQHEVFYYGICEKCKSKSDAATE